MRLFQLGKVLISTRKRAAQSHSKALTGFLMQHSHIMVLPLVLLM
jgi:hypothetical protein